MHFARLVTSNNSTKSNQPSPIPKTEPNKTKDWHIGNSDPVHNVQIVMDNSFALRVEVYKRIGGWGVAMFFKIIAYNKHGR